MKTIAISIGDINGVGLEIALKSHNEISKICKPVYFINRALLMQGANLLNLKIPDDFDIFEVGDDFKINPGLNDAKSGEFSFLSFLEAIKFTQDKKADALLTLPVNKKSWEMTKIPYVGHTDFLSKYFKKDAIMMLGCDEMFVALFTIHIPLSKVSDEIKFDKLQKFLIDFYNCTKFDNIDVLGLNPHASDNGVIGGEEELEIKKAIKFVNESLGDEIFNGPKVPDTAFIGNKKRIVAMYHDQGLAPLKALYFDKSINVSLNLPILRVSVDHGTAFDIAYKNKAKTKSYLEAINYILNKA